MNIYNNFKCIQTISDVYILVNPLWPGEIFSSYANTSQQSSHIHTSSFVFSFARVSHLHFITLNIRISLSVIFLHRYLRSIFSFFFLHNSYTFIIVFISYSAMAVLFILVWFILLHSSHAILDRNMVVSCNQSFDTNNWTHYVFLILVIVAGLVFLAFVIYLYKRCWPIFKLACKQNKQQQQAQHVFAQLPSMSAPAYQPPYAHPPNVLPNQFPQQYTSFLLSSPREPPTSSTMLQAPIVS